MDFDVLYVKFQFYGISDERFTYYNLDFQPFPLVLSFISAIEKQQVNMTNLSAKTDAIGWSFIMNSFSEKNKIKYLELLPIPDEVTETSKVSEGYNKPTKYTINCISRLIEQNRIPRRVMMALAGTGVLHGL